MTQNEISEIEMIIVSLISRDKKNPTSMKALRDRTGMTRREITEVIKSARRFYPICATRIAPGGYWIGGKDDIENMLVYYGNSILTMIETRDNLVKFLKEDTCNDERF